jgi:hypothetical protein
VPQNESGRNASNIRHSLAREGSWDYPGRCLRLEKRSDLLLSTPRKTVEATGGSLSLVAEFPDRAPVLSGIADHDPGLSPQAASGRAHARRLSSDEWHADRHRRLADVHYRHLMMMIASVSFKLATFDSTEVATALSILRVVVPAAAVVRILKWYRAIKPFPIGFCPPDRVQT